MRVNKMKNVLRRIGAFALVFMMAVQPAGRMDAGIQEAKAADISGVTIKKATNTRFDMEVEGAVDGKISLEKGDMFTVKIIRNTSTNTLARAKSISGWLRFYTQTPKGEYVPVDGYISEVHLADPEPLISGTKVTIGDALPRKITVDCGGSPGIDIDPGTEIMSINVWVKTAVDNLKIEFGGSAPDSDIEVRRYSSSTSGEIVSAENQGNAVAEVTNKWAENRKLSFTVAGSSGSGKDIQVPIKYTKNSRAKIAVKVNKDNGTPKNIGYSGFSLKVTYDPQYLKLYGGNYYELSDAGKAVENKLKTSEIGGRDDFGNRWYKVSFIDNSSDGKGIGVYEDFLYLSFVPADNKEWKDLQGVNTAVTVTVMGGVDQFSRRMKTEVNGDNSYYDNDKGEDGGNMVFNVSFVKSLFKFGDVNNDTYVNLIDAVMILRYYNGDASLTEDQLARANVKDDYWDRDSTDSSGVHKKGDPLVDLVDAVLIIECYNGTRSEDDLPLSGIN